MRNHKKMMIAPIVITVIAVVYYLVYFGLIIHEMQGLGRYALGILPLLLIYIMIKMCIERIKEIQEGETDDLSKY